MQPLSFKNADYTPYFKEIKGGNPMIGMTKVNISDVHDQQVVIQNNMSFETCSGYEFLRWEACREL